MSKEEAMLIRRDNPESQEAVETLKYYAKLEWEAAMRKRDEQVLQFRIQIPRGRFGEPPRNGPWPDDVFQALLRKEEEVLRQTKTLGLPDPELSRLRSTCGSLLPLRKLVENTFQIVRIGEAFEATYDVADEGRIYQCVLRTDLYGISVAFERTEKATQPEAEGDGERRSAP